MYNKILEYINKYDKIIIHRHKNPDLDALGSQIGLKALLNLNFPTKEVYVVGDMGGFNFLGSMDEIEDSVFEGALSIVVDVAVSYMVSDERYKLSDFVMVIDHHLNSSDFADYAYNDSSLIACAQIISDMAQSNDFKINAEAATALFGGLVTDSGRFLYPNTKTSTFEIAAYLAKNGADIQFIYDNLYIETLNFKKLKGYFINNFSTTKRNVAYMKNNPDVKDKFEVSSFVVSRAMVNQMSGIKGVPMWVNFTMDDEGLIQTEIRSKNISVVEVAKKYGGGGHLLACGCTLSSWEDTDKVLEDLDQLLT